MTAGRPPKPNELKRKTGNPGKRALPDLKIVQAIPMAASAPEAPDYLGDDGVKLWNQLWDEAISWLSPVSDMTAIENAAMLADDLRIARDRYRATREPADGRVLIQINKSFVDALSSLGFDPTSRSRLGVAEVKAMSAIDKLLEKRQAR
jgi:phage terminase small subunit